MVLTTWEKQKLKNHRYNCSWQIKRTLCMQKKHQTNWKFTTTKNSNLKNINIIKNCRKSYFCTFKDQRIGWIETNLNEWRLWQFIRQCHHGELLSNVLFLVVSPQTVCIFLPKSLSGPTRGGRLGFVFSHNNEDNKSLTWRILRENIIKYYIWLFKVKQHWWHVYRKSLITSM